ncbi:MAG: DUF1874 domain-containing protein [Pyrobaculum arsenaticum]|uniref:STIV orfB116 family protein n=1 Tax=Pyrobaculum arsenaticum TaxID=121277 RepID=UPI002272B343|nr:DUF1874 domain-containing protein [Pyrobaculum arsenaticum]
MTLYLLNSLVTPFKDEKAYFFIKVITAEEAKKIVQHHKDFTSAVGHAPTADALSLLLGVKVPMNRISIYFEVGDEAIAISLRKRLQEGQVIKSIQELQEIGYDLFYIKRVA